MADASMRWSGRCNESHSWPGDAKIRQAEHRAMKNVIRMADLLGRQRTSSTSGGTAAGGGSLVNKASASGGVTADGDSQVDRRLVARNIVLMVSYRRSRDSQILYRSG